MKQLWLLLLCVIGLAACGSTYNPPIQADDPRFAPIIPEYPVEMVEENGTLFKAELATSLYSDVTARRVGDIITVNLAESNNATKLANTITINNSTNEIEPIIGLGNEAATISGQSLALGVESSKNFFGDARTNQSNSLFGAISVSVVDVLPNKNLVIRGEKWIRINDGDEYIRLTGIIRPADISPTNSISSTQVANARIQYSGTGALANSQKKGWLAKFFDSKWWPM